MSGKTFTNSTTIQEEAEYSQPAKRRRTSTGRKAGPGMLVEIPDDINSFRKNGNGGMADSRGHSHDDVEGDEHIAIASTGKHAEQTVAPFLARHVPDQYAPLGGHIQVKSSEPKGPNSKFCYRHQPDLKCRRQADEPSMDQLQRVSCLSTPRPDAEADSARDLLQLAMEFLVITSTGALSGGLQNIH